MMFLMLMYSLILTILVIFMFLMNLILSKKMFKNREKNSSFECGFDSISKNRMPFSLQFYLISIIFLIFDIEISIILPFIFSNNLNFYYFVNFMSLIILILLLGLIMEWHEGALKWFK
uniref:NADH dehydrogenase subunit 3 n=1 Tax=Ooencyrtus plautus TaxID=2989845 RepID=UPI002237C5DD|nr:NADH dehydrogenase subunit 3 [Ooencyrtus plautus]UYP50989.1 NADH dehydrogenase subunit 3 [Ooencyrtus plautus]